MGRIFNTDNVVFRFFSTVGYIWWLHILWLVCSIPVITIGASTTALCYSCMKLHKKEGYVTENFFKSFRENFRQATGIFLIFLLVGGILALDMMVFGLTGFASNKIFKYLIGALMVVYFITLIYVFAVQAKFNNTIRRTIQYAFVLACKNPGSTIQMILLVGILAALNCTIVLVNFLTISVGIGVVMYFLAAYYNRIFDRLLERVLQKN